MLGNLINSILGTGGSSAGSGTVAASSVPEIDASTGLLALAAVGAVMLFAWERRRRITTDN